MIVELNVENLAIIERSRLELGPGFTVLTGETGAGKSLLIDAIELALGERADSELVRAGATRASVNVVLDLSAEITAQQKCADLGIELEDGKLFIQREVAVEGRSQCRIGGKLTPVSTLKQLGACLVDLHGQHDHQSLLDREQHVSYLDAWIGQPAKDLLALVAEAFTAAETARRRLAELRTGIREREQKLDLLRFQVSDIEAVSPYVGEFDELEAQLTRLKHAEKLASASYAALSAVSDDENCVVDGLSLAVKALEDAMKFDPSLEAVVAPLREALYQIEEGAHGLRAYSEGLDADPTSLDTVAERIDALKRLRRKYGEDEVAVLAYLEETRAQLAILEDAEASEENLLTTYAAAQLELVAACGQLTKLRQKRSEEFGELVQSQLRDLAMDRALFSVGFSARTPDASGADDVEFIFSANAGEAPKPLGKIASGGEVSRVMLAIKTALAGKAGVPTLIFDEVDAGLGGRAAATVARKLEELSQFYQVVVISHLPQIASRATTHYRIEKVESSGRVNTQVRYLNPDERIEEIARMLAGESVTESAMANARELLCGSALSL